MRQSASAPSTQTTQTELTEKLHVDPEQGIAQRTAAPVMMADDAEVRRQTERTSRTQIRAIAGGVMQSG